MKKAKAKKRDLARERYERVLDQIPKVAGKVRRYQNRLHQLLARKSTYERRRPDLVRAVLLKRSKPVNVAPAGANISNPATR